MKIPHGYTERTVLNDIEHVTERLSRHFKFGYYTIKLSIQTQEPSLASNINNFWQFCQGYFTYFGLIIGPFEKLSIHHHCTIRHFVQSSNKTSYRSAIDCHSNQVRTLTVLGITVNRLNKEYVRQRLSRVVVEPTLVFSVNFNPISTQFQHIY